jgi:hypothetical protein
MAKCSRCSGIKIGKRASMAELGALHGGGHGASIALLARQHEQRRGTRGSGGALAGAAAEELKSMSSGALMEAAARGAGAALPAWAAVAAWSRGSGSRACPRT